MMAVHFPTEIVEAAEPSFVVHPTYSYHCHWLYLAVVAALLLVVFQAVPLVLYPVASALTYHYLVTYFLVVVAD